ncbi:MAG: DUF378 domain-containing protein [Oscillospiraceae bacterium]|nr:DUF378 domain-containing protein [Oscillospiraceae bacterium]
MNNSVTWMDRIALALIVIGGINWGLIGVFDFDLVAWIFGGPEEILSRLVYALVGVGALWGATLLFRPREERA